MLAAQYESWSLPLAVILVVPMCLLSAIIGVCVMPRILPQSLVGAHPQIDINIFTADRLRRARGPGEQERDPDRRVRQAAARRRSRSRREAALSACKLRLRPIVMTSFAFILGVFPLVDRPRRRRRDAADPGHAVFSGMLGVTLFGIFLTPVFFSVIDWLGTSEFFRSRMWRWIRLVTLGFSPSGS